MGAKAITRTRGDTYSDRIYVRDGFGAIPDITGWTFTLTINKVQEPEDTADQLVQIAGTITDIPNGVVEFAWTDIDADQVPGTYYYDIQVVDGSSKKRTPVVDNYIFTQDITKT